MRRLLPALLLLAGAACAEAEVDNNPSAAPDAPLSSVDTDAIRAALQGLDAPDTWRVGIVVEEGIKGYDAELRIITADGTVHLIDPAISCEITDGYLNGLVQPGDAVAWEDDGDVRVCKDEISVVRAAALGDER
jgi:hypothetical protein